MVGEEVMSSYRFLSAHFINNRYYAAGETASTRDVIGGSLPLTWPPTPASEPLDASAVAAFYAAGPWPESQIDLFVAPPATYWLADPTTKNPTRYYSLTGPLGVGFAAKLGGS
jgi:hypothetical protein